MTATLFGPHTPVRIVALERTCLACPAQWEGESDTGAAVYIRFREGRLRVHVGPGIDAAIDRDPVYSWRDEDRTNGWMSDTELRDRLPEWIIWGAS